MNKKQIIVSSLCVLAGAAFSACDDLFEPANENILSFEEMFQNPYYADNYLGICYTMIPNGSSPSGGSISDLATSDAVSNQADNDWRKMTEGNWKADSDPTSRWNNCRGALNIVNKFLENVDKVDWASDPIIARLFEDREFGEAYGLRALFMYYALEAHAGKVNGDLFGIPLLLESEDINSDFNQPRATFAECLAQIDADVEKALEYLPMDYPKSGSDVPGYKGEKQDYVPAKYISEFPEITNAQYMRVFDANYEGRMSGRIAKAIQAKAHLLAASKAFGVESMEKAANLFGELVDYKYTQMGGKMEANGLSCWYDVNNKDAIEKIGTVPSDEMLWRAAGGESADMESNNYPQSIGGSGHVNPTQNLVDAFYASNGYPISHAKANFDAQNPYSNRDPRLAMYIVVDGSTLSKDNVVINIADDAEGDGKDKIGGAGQAEMATRTGYYMRKWIREDAVYNSADNAITAQRRYTPRIRYTELYLSYAEAANAAWGAKGKGSHQVSAYDVIKMIRERAGICVGETDGYLDECAANTETMAALIKNERRLELCFEGFRFWDLRRWADAQFTEVPQGVRISRANKTYTKFDLVKPALQPYMYYGPVPYAEILKYDALKQNDGWN